MIRIYFDWNIYSYMRNCRNEKFSEISKFIEDNSSSILLTYSPAHLQDLKRSYFNSEVGKIETEKDLEFLGELTVNHCLWYDYKNKIVDPIILSPKEYFIDIFVTNSFENIFDFDSIFDKDDPFGKLWKSHWELLETLPSGIDFSEFEKIPKKYQSIKDIFKTTKDNNTLGSLIKYVMIPSQQPKEFEKAFKEIREALNKDLKINTDNSKCGDPFEYQDNILLKSNLQKKLFDLTTETIKNSNKNASRFDYFFNYYIKLDMFGYHKDKKIPNLIDDAAHAFYGAHTDIFVTDDYNANMKSKALYKQLNISTEVINSDELISAIRRKKVFKKEKSLFEQIGYVIKNSLLLTDSIDKELNPSKIFKLEPLLLDFFNRLQISEYEKSTAFYFYKLQGNYSNFMFWTEIMEVVNKFNLELGTDYNNKRCFEESEKGEIIDNKWVGRLWKIQRTDLALYYNEQPFGLTLKIEIIKPNC